MEEIIKNTLFKRIEWIDIARAVGIISVIICHAKLPGVQKYICGPIEVTIFFFISGFLLYRKEQPSFLTFLKKENQGNSGSVFIFSVIWIIYDLCLLLTTKQLSPANALQVFLQYLLQIRMKPIWVLTCLFLSEIAMFFTIKFLKNTYVAVAVAFVFVFVGFVYYRYVNYALPWNADLCVVAVPFMIIGYLCNKTSALNFISKKKAWLLILGIIPVYFVLNYLNVFALNNGIDIFYKEFGNYFIWLHYWEF